MARGINKVIIIGTLGQDPESKLMPSGNAVTNVSVATNETWKDKNSGQPQQRTEWHRVVFFNRLGEIAAQLLQKGTMIYIEGSLRTRKWQAQDGTDRYTTEIVASEFQVIANGVPRDESEPQSAAPASTGHGEPARAAQPEPQGQQSNTHPTDGHFTNDSSQSFDHYHDDIPF